MRRLRCSLHAAFVAMVVSGPVIAWAQGGTKPSIHGLVTMGRMNFVHDPSILPSNSLREARAHPGVYSGAVVLATWAELEPTRGQFSFGAIDQALANIRAYNAQYPATPLVAKLRIFGGVTAPDWAKQLDGGPVTASERDNTVSVGHFWSPPYRAAWRELQNALAARYDANPLVEEVAISSCSSSTAEPFVVPLNRANLPPLIAAGYTDAAMQACLMGAVDDYAAWTHVALDYTFNPWRSVASGHPRPDPGFTLQVMDAFRQRLGSRGVIANHGLTPQTNPAAASTIDEMHRLGGPIEFQTRSPNQDWDASVATGEQDGMTELEVWNSRAAGGGAPVTMDELRAWRSQLIH